MNHPATLELTADATTITITVTPGERRTAMSYPAAGRLARKILHDIDTSARGRRTDVSMSIGGRRTTLTLGSAISLAERLLDLAGEDT